MSYQIKYNYDTGDSFSQSLDNEGILELEWKDFEVAKANLVRIKEHYEQYRDLNSHFTKFNPQEILLQNFEKDWFVHKPRLVAYKEDITNYNAVDEKDIKRFEEAGYKTAHIIDTTDATNQIILYTDKNKPWQLWAPWCGYFETLNWVEIISKDLDTKIYL